MDAIQELGGNTESLIKKIKFVPHPNYRIVYGRERTDIMPSNTVLKLLFFGNIKKYKNVEMLVEIVRELNFCDMELTICGDINKTDVNLRHLLNIVNNQPRIKVCFRRISDDEIPTLLAAHHLVVLPYDLKSSINSGAAIMSFSYGRTVISPKNGTLEEMPDHEIFFSYEYTTPEEHREKLRCLLYVIHDNYYGHYNDLLILGEKCRDVMVSQNNIIVTAQALSRVFTKF
jgi:glycosyltransferase involved in cell wall biosynthesis